MLMTFYLRVSNITTNSTISAVICSAWIYAWVNAFYLILKREIRRNNGLFKDIYQTWSYIIKRYNFRIILFSLKCRAVFESKMVKLAIQIYLFFGIKWNLLQSSSNISPWLRCESENTPFLCKQYFSVCKRSNCWSKNQFLW